MWVYNILLLAVLTTCHHLQKKDLRKPHLRIMMAHRKSPHTGFTFFYLALLFAFALLADASSPQQVNHKRLLRKRAPQGLGQPGVNPALTPPSRTSLSASSTAQTDSASSVVPTSTPLIVNPLPSSSSTSVTSVSLFLFLWALPYD